MYFSEDLKSVDEFDQLNLTSISNDFIFDVQFESNHEMNIDEN